ncbi:FAD:protein FMN transferase [Phototrophicus methaneseepsis]|uniref:FAD:protein FMN transferase n=1 Tax=Phototrophicus methaneseepsis TaxID=2710758 RepID=A0A7S8ECK4_9CHLR|nr:FAD:protein FMN transferase [Phototrophicus methaneseepsis]QPC84483.1 FAD:protein FMN transferase [Phototrophicus methaneseepsis]
MKQSSGLSRRQFIRITASAGALLASGLGYGMAVQGQAVHVEEAQMLLGSIAHLTIISTEPDRARQAIQAAFRRMADLEAVFSRFQPASQLSQLNATGSLTNADPALQEVLARAIEYGDLTSGAFDVTVEPLLRLYREAAQKGGAVAEPVVLSAKQLVNYRQISITNSTLRLNKSGMSITLDGIAKGYIIDAGTSVLSEYGFEHIMVELGGDLQTRGDADGRPWQVRIEKPSVPSAAMSLVAQLNNTAMATSGDYQYTFTPDRRLHHIIDPSSGVSPDELASASVIAGTACDADALSTSVLVMGASAGLELIDRLPGVEALVMTKEGTVYHSAHFPLL